MKLISNVPTNPSHRLSKRSICIITYRGMRKYNALQQGFDAKFPQKVRYSNVKSYERFDERVKQNYLLRLILGAVFAISFIGSFLRERLDVCNMRIKREGTQNGFECFLYQSDPFLERFSDVHKSLEKACHIFKYHTYGRRTERTIHCGRVYQSRSNLSHRDYLT